MSKNVLLVGCGQLGSRHLQAIASLGDIARIDVFDTDPAGLVLGQARLKEVVDANPAVGVRWFTQLDRTAKDVDLCVVATQAKGRGRLIKDIVAHTGCRKFFIEKIVAQSMREYDDLMIFCAKSGVRVWVNCKARAYGAHQYVRSCLDPDKPLTMSVLAGNFGLANSGIHEADLFVFYDKAKGIELLSADIDEGLLPSKRGSDLWDLSGCLRGRSARGSRLHIVFDPSHMHLEWVVVGDDKSRFLVDYAGQVVCESRLENQWRMVVKDFKEDWRVSAMTRNFVRQLLAGEACVLPTLAEAAIAHRFILSSLQPYFNRLLKTELNCCPVT